MLRQTQTFLWRLVAVVAVGLGLVGVALPVLPTVPFLLLAAWAAARGWPALEQRLLEHAVYGAHIRAWRERGVVPRRAKLFATFGMGVSAVGLQLLPLAGWVQVGVPLVMLTVAVWLWWRPEA